MVRWDPLAGFSQTQRDQLDRFEELLVRATRRSNLISRLTIGEFRRIHTLHSLALSLRDFPDGARVVDWGTGGGLPGIPLAIRFPSVDFVLVDSIRKNVELVRAMILSLGLKNVEVVQSRAEEWAGPSDYAVSRATAPLADLWEWTTPHLNDPPVTDDMPTGIWLPGLLALKGGDLVDEISELSDRHPDARAEVIELWESTGDYEGKSIVHVTRNQPPRHGG